MNAEERILKYYYWLWTINGHVPCINQQKGILVACGSYKRKYLTNPSTATNIKQIMTNYSIEGKLSFKEKLSFD